MRVYSPGFKASVPASFTLRRIQETSTQRYATVMKETETWRDWDLLVKRFLQPRIRYLPKEDESEHVLERLYSRLGDALVSAESREIPPVGLDTKRIGILEENWVQKRDLTSLYSLIDYLSRTILDFLGTKHLLLQLSWEISRWATRIQNKASEAIYLREYLEDLAEFVLELHRISLRPPEDNTEIERFLGDILEAQLSIPAIYDAISRQCSSRRDLVVFLHTHREQIRDQLLWKLYVSLTESSLNFQKVSNIVDSFQLISYLVKENDDEKGNELLKIHDHMLELLITLPSEVE